MKRVSAECDGNLIDPKNGPQFTAFWPADDLQFNAGRSLVPPQEVESARFQPRLPVNT